MEIHFYDCQISVPADVGQYYGWMDTIRAVNSHVDQIHTTQMGLLRTALFERGYHIFVHSFGCDTFEIKLGGENSNTRKEIRMAHNLFKMWESGALS